MKRGIPRRAVGDGPIDEDTATHIWAADLHQTPDGRFLYSSERSSSTLTGFCVDAKGTLTRTQILTTERQPRAFAIDSKGEFLIACGQLSDTISAYRIEPDTGRLLSPHKAAAGAGASWIEVVTMT